MRRVRAGRRGSLFRRPRGSSFQQTDWHRGKALQADEVGNVLSHLVSEPSNPGEQMRRFRFGIALSATTAALALAAAPALADNHEWVMEGDEYPTGTIKGIAYGGRPVRDF